MRKVLVSRFGEPDVLEMQETPAPTPEADEIIIKVSYAGVGAIDVIMRKGGLKEVNLRPPFTPGIEVSGTVEAVGEAVDNFAPGQFVAAMMLPDGGYAEYVRAKAALSVALPSEADLPAAASIVNFVTAHVALSRFARLGNKDTVVIHGASGGLGTACIQTALLLEPSVFLLATVREPEKKAYVEQLGCTEVHTSEEFIQAAAQGHDYSVVIDPIGGQLRRASLTALKPYGRLLAVGNVSDDYQSNISSQQLWLEGKTVMGFNLALYASLFAAEVNSAMQAIVAAIASRKFAPTPTKVFEFSQVEDAHRYQENDRAAGRVLLHM